MTGNARAVNISASVAGNIAGLFDAAFTSAGHRPVFRSPQGEVLLTYSELRDEVARYANALVSFGIEPGDRVSVQIEKSIAGVILYLAVMRCGGVYQPLNTAYTLAEIEYFISDAAPKIVVCDSVRRPEIHAVTDHHGVSALLDLDSSGNGTLAERAREMASNHDCVPRDSDDLAGLIYTSGTTGRSKGAMISHGNLASNALALHRIWNFVPGDVLIHALPIYHVHGLHVALGTAFLNGSEIIWFEKFDAEAIIAALPQASVLMGVPTFYTRLLSSQRLTSQSCRRMRLFVSGSAPLLAETHHAFAERTGHAILERYGMTETGMIASNSYQGARIAGSVGFALPEVSVRVADDDGCELPRGEIGIIEVKGPNVFRGYWRMPEKTAQEFRKDGYFITGDVATMDREGRIAILGRAKDVIITGGFNVYPKEVEDELDAIEGIVESAVVGIPHPDWGESIVAVVIARRALPSEAEMLKNLAGRLAKFKLPKRIFVADELPRNAMGKVQKAALREKYKEIFTQA